MLDYVKNNKIVIITSVFLIIILVFIIIEWYEFKKVRHRVIKLDKQVRLIEKNQLYLERLVVKDVKPSSSFFVKGKSPVKQKQPAFLAQSSPILLSRILVSEDKHVKKMYGNDSNDSNDSNDDDKIVEIDDDDEEGVTIKEIDDVKITEVCDEEEDSENEQDDETNQSFDEKTLDLELKDELKELN